MQDPTVQSNLPSFSASVWDGISHGYDETSREYLGLFSQAAIGRLAPQPTWRMLDVACGPGTTTLHAAPLVASVAALDLSLAMLQRLELHLRMAGHGNVSLHHADGQSLPFEDGSFDCAVSMFGLMFFHDPVRGMREMARVLRPNGKVAISSWAPAQASPLVFHMFEALKLITPTLATPERSLASLEDPAVFSSAMSGAGFRDVEIERVQRDLHFNSVEEYWSIMVKGAVPLHSVRMRLDEASWAQGEARALEHLRSALAGQNKLCSVAYLAYATV